MAKKDRIIHVAVDRNLREFLVRTARHYDMPISAVIRWAIANMRCELESLQKQKVL